MTLDPTTLVNSLTTSLTQNPIDSRRRQANNAALGLVTVSTEGNSCLTAGIHPDLPNIFIKVVTYDDPSLTYAQAILNGELEGPLFPEIQSITFVGEQAIILMERLDIEEEYFDFSTENALDQLTKHPDIQSAEDELKARLSQYEIEVDIEGVNDLGHWLLNHGLVADMHQDNYGLRKGTRTLVVFDPAYEAAHFNHIQELEEEEI